MSDKKINELGEQEMEQVSGGTIISVRKYKCSKCGKIYGSNRPSVCNVPDCDGIIAPFLDIIDA